MDKRIKMKNQSLKAQSSCRRTPASHQASDVIHPKSVVDHEAVMPTHRFRQGLFP
jgi:hypothetical protein